MTKIVEMIKGRKGARVVLYWAMLIISLYALVHLFGPDRVWTLIEWIFGAVFPDSSA